MPLLPPLIFGGAHDSPLVYSFIKEILPALIEKGYKVLCVERGNHDSEVADATTIVSSSISHAETIMARGGATTLREKLPVDTLEADREALSLLQCATAQKMITKSYAMHHASVCSDGLTVEAFTAVLARSASQAEKKAANFLSQLGERGLGIIFVCGAAHVEGIAAMLAENNTLSPCGYEPISYILTESAATAAGLRRAIPKTHPDARRLEIDADIICLSDAEQRTIFYGKLCSQIEATQKVFRLPAYCTDTPMIVERMREVYDLPFQCVLQKGGDLRVNAIVELTQDNQQALRQAAENMQRRSIATLNFTLFGRQHLMVPGVNTPAVAEKIGSMRKP